MIDLHTHTTYSDGHSTLPELLREAKKKKIEILSITDHNTVAAYEELKKPEVNSLFSDEIINGVEITTTYSGEVIEILGYGFNLDIMKKLLNENVLTFEQKQKEEYNLIKKTYENIGLRINIDNIIFNPKKESCRISFVNEIKKYPENYKYFLCKDSIVTNSGFTRNEVYNPKSPLYVDQSSLYPSLKKTIEIIHQAGGLAFLAHTFVYSKTIANSLNDIILNYKLDGLECYYTTFTKEQTDYLLNLCDSYKLYKSGGSDFHGTNKVNHNLGTGDGTLLINKDLIEDWIKLKSSTKQ